MKYVSPRPTGASFILSSAESSATSWVAKPAILDRQILDVARDLCRHQAHGLALGLYLALHSEPPPPCECGLGAQITLHCRFMGEDMETWLYGSEETPLLLPTRRLPRTGRNVVQTEATR